MTSFDVNLMGIAGIKEPRKVAVYVFTDKKDRNLQHLRMVCTWPMNERKVCRDWSTGKLIPNEGQ